MVDHVDIKVICWKLVNVFSYGCFSLSYFRRDLIKSSLRLNDVRDGNYFEQLIHISRLIVINDHNNHSRRRRRRFSLRHHCG